MGGVWGTEVSRTSGIASYEIVRGQASASSFSDKFSLPEGCHLVGNRTFEDKNMDLSAGCGKYQSSYFFPHNPHLRLHYLNTGKAASEFSSLVEAFGNNPYILCDILNFELSYIKDRAQEEGSINKILNRRIKKCEADVSKVQQLLEKKNGSIDTSDLNECLDKLGKAFERMASIGNPSEPVQIAKAKFHNKSLSCSTSTKSKLMETPIFSNPLTKFKYKAFAEKVTSKDLSDPGFLEICWKAAFSCGTMSVEIEDSINHYSTVNMKSCENLNGDKYLEISDPTKIETEVKNVNIQS